MEYMKKIFFLFIIIHFFFSLTLAHFPEREKIYNSNDYGFSQYRTLSLNNSKTVVLTFDDGPRIGTTDRVLDLLYQYRVKATFFILTQKVTDKTMYLIERMFGEGHIVASHSHSMKHRNSNNISKNIFHDDFFRSIMVIEKLDNIFNASNQVEIYYRFPYGAYGRAEKYHHLNVLKKNSYEIFNDNCINYVFWDIDSQDWFRKLTSFQIAQNILSSINGGIYYKPQFVIKSNKKKRTVVEEYMEYPVGGGIILLHDIYEKSVEALSVFLGQIETEDIRVVPLSEVQEYSYYGRKCKVQR